MNKEKIYGQIESFFNSKESKNDSKKIGDKYFYVDSQKSKDSALFFKYFLKENKIDLASDLIIMDLCFGSGNLTSHIVLDNDLDVNKIYLNDIDKKVTNQKINIDKKSEILNFDFLDFKQFKNFEDIVDVVVFNPTISDNDIHRKISINEKDKIVYRNIHLDIKVAFKQYCEELSLKIVGDFQIDRDNRTITVEIEGKKELLNKLPNSFNGYSLICKTKSMQSCESRATTVTKINQTISSILKEDGLIVFIGTDKQREVIFQDYNTVFRYLRDDNDIFVIKKSDTEILKCFEKDNNEFIQNDDCKLSSTQEDDQVESFDDIEIIAYDDNEDRKEEEKFMKSEEKEKFVSGGIDYIFPHKNLLLKGVPGTGKSYTIERIIEDKFKLKGEDKKNNVRHINIHSASSNADLMQGIGIESNDGKIEYQEKQGLIFNHIKKALFAPNQPFVLVLEEIQENSLNELIGDLIYLIEEKKRVTVDASKFEDGKKYEYQAFIEEVLKVENNKHHIEIPYLVDTSTAYRKMVLPSNLYIFCTSNYRDDKKVIEDNLLRRFDVVEIYPQTQEQLGEDVFKSKDISDFLERLNRKILEQFTQEIHSDRYLIGHANWLDITEEDNDDNRKRFYTALLKVIIEFKEIREVDFNSDVNPILQKLLKKDDGLSERVENYLEIFYDNNELRLDSYKSLIEKLQKEIYSFLK